MYLWVISVCFVPFIQLFNAWETCKIFLFLLPLICLSACWHYKTVYHSFLFCPGGKNVSSNKQAPRMDFAMCCRKALWLLCRKSIPSGISFPPAVSACVCSKTNHGPNIVADYQLNRCLIFSTLIMNQKECVVHTWAVTDSRYKDDLTCPRRKPGTAQGIPALRGRVCLASQGSPLWQNRSGNAAENDSRNCHINFDSVWHRESQLCFFRASHSIRKSH